MWIREQRILLLFQQRSALWFIVACTWSGSPSHHNIINRILGSLRQQLKCWIYLLCTLLLSLSLSLSVYYFYYCCYLFLNEFRLRWRAREFSYAINSFAVLWSRRKNFAPPPLANSHWARRAHGQHHTNYCFVPIKWVNIAHSVSPGNRVSSVQIGLKASERASAKCLHAANSGSSCCFSFSVLFIYLCISFIHGYWNKQPQIETIGGAELQNQRHTITIRSAHIFIYFKNKKKTVFLMPFYRRRNSLADGK